MLQPWRTAPTAMLLLLPSTTLAAPATAMLLLLPTTAVLSTPPSTNKCLDGSCCVTPVLLPLDVLLAAVLPPILPPILPPVLQPGVRQIVLGSGWGLVLGGTVYMGGLVGSYCDERLQVSPGQKLDGSFMS